uniref:Uncharacterized protein n=1 Tax=Ascaris lumbricoides TaxID=6252 RepID=A0A9J2PKU6_ASCLU
MIQKTPMTLHSSAQKLFRYHVTYAIRLLSNKQLYHFMDRITIAEVYSINRWLTSISVRILEGNASE